jgi:nitroreductase
MDIATVDKLLTTTRSVRKRLDLERPVEREVIEECLNIAIQAPTGSNTQGWHFMVVTDAEKRAKIAEYYRTAWEGYKAQQASSMPSSRPALKQMIRVVRSAEYLAEHMHEVPIFVIPCIEGRVEDSGAMLQASLYGSVLPAAWSFMLALRARGLGSSWTTLHLFYEKEVSEILGIPSHITQTALLPVAYYTGDDFRPAKRNPASELTHWDNWG